jgi:hypothetical protein
VRQKLRNLSHHEALRDRQLADSNLPAIVAHRVVRPKDDPQRSDSPMTSAKTARCGAGAECAHR